MEIKLGDRLRIKNYLLAKKGDDDIGGDRTALTAAVSSVMLGEDMAQLLATMIKQRDQPQPAAAITAPHRRTAAEEAGVVCSLSNCGDEDPCGPLNKVFDGVSDCAECGTKKYSANNLFGCACEYSCSVAQPEPASGTAGTSASTASTDVDAASANVEGASLWIEEGSLAFGPQADKALSDGPTGIHANTNLTLEGALTAQSVTVSGAFKLGQPGDEACTSANDDGVLRWDPEKKKVEVCSASKWKSLAPGSPNTCLDVLAMGDTADGIYEVKPNPLAATVSVFCDMTTNGGGWTQIEYLHSDAEGKKDAYSSVFSSATMGNLGAGSYKINVPPFLAHATELRLSQPANCYPDSEAPGDSRTSSAWGDDVVCEITAGMKQAMQNEKGEPKGTTHDLKCYRIDGDARTLSSTAIKFQYVTYEGLSWGGTTVPHLCIGQSGGNLNYVPDGVCLWKNADSTVGAYSDMTGTNAGDRCKSIAFWLR